MARGFGFMYLAMRSKWLISNLSKLSTSPSRRRLEASDATLGLTGREASDVGVTLIECIPSAVEPDAECNAQTNLEGAGAAD